MNYLDNQNNHKKEPNENYARELLELHTLGVEGGYTAKDVAEVARVFTGWREENFAFHFKSSHHDFNEKIVLSQNIPSGLGMEGGEMVLDLLSTHPSTAQYICTKLLKLFVSDTPNALSVESCSNNFLDNSGQDNQIANVLEGIFRSATFSANENFHSKVKNPLEFVAGLTRQLPIHLSLPSTRKILTTMGMPMFRYPLPTGFPESSKHWVNSNRYFQYVQFINLTVLHDSRKTHNYMDDPAIFFKQNGYETAEAIAGYLFNSALANDYSELEWGMALNILTENGTITFNINSNDASQRIKTLLITLLNFPTYQLQ
jgi:uncharacterized protein (DUF1800 family)